MYIVTVCTLGYAIVACGVPETIHDDVRTGAITIRAVHVKRTVMGRKVERYGVTLAVDCFRHERRFDPFNDVQ